MHAPNRPPLTPELVAGLAAATGCRVEPDDLDEITGLITALFDLESNLDRFDVSEVEPELTWDARWASAE